MGKCGLILIVDDESVNVKIAARILGDTYDIESVSSGKEALIFLEQVRPDLILLDINMPETDGFTVLEEINNESMDIPVIFLTANTDKDTEIRGFKMGAADFITKPFVPEILIERVSRTLEFSRMKKKLQQEVKLQTEKAMESKKELEKTKTDTLTGLLMRNSGEKKITAAMKSHSGMLIFFDVDNLKKINDQIGHKAGDKVLRLMGDTLKKKLDSCGALAHACRLGGDEFLAFIESDDSTFVVEVVEKIMHDFLEAKDRDIEIKDASLSVGMCETAEDDIFSDAYNKADKALYHVKQNGKAGYFIYKDAETDDTISKDVDLSKIISAVKNSGSYNGAMDVELREFSKIFEYLKKFSNRYDHEIRLALITLEKPKNERVFIEEIEEAMKVMEDAINRTIRNVDVCTRYSSLQFLVIMIDVGDENTELVLERIMMKYYENYKGDRRIKPVYTVEEVDKKSMGA